MKLIIAGSRTLKPSGAFLMSAILMSNIDVKSLTEIVSGGASGVDSSALEFSQQVWYDLNIDYKEFPADWDTHGKAAGPIRNKQMAEYANALLLIWDGESRGSASMKREMLKLGKPVYEIIIKRSI